MKIAITCENGHVFQHFGHTPEFAIFTIENGKIISDKTIACGTSGHGALAELLVKENVDILICGGIGGGAIAALEKAGIQLIGGASGEVREVAVEYLLGCLTVNADYRCHHHDEQAHDCGTHHTCGGDCSVKRPPFI